jgi:serine phosphatase RsbU (regulator of sigma subunit)
LLHADNSVQRLAATATVMGLFPEWDCKVAEEQLHPGDLFAIYTDGVTEAADPTGDEFGEERLIETLRRNRKSVAASLLQSVIQSVQQFSPGEQGDDITVVVARVV